MAFAAPLVPLLASAGTFLGSPVGIAALTAAGAGLGAVNSIQQGKYAAAVARNNAQVAERNAAAQSQAAQAEAKRSDINYAALLGEQMAAQGASGFDLLGRSATNARMLTRRTRGQEATDISRAGADAAQRSLQEAANFRGEASAAKRQGYINAAGQLISAGSDLMSGGTFIGRRGRRKPWESR